MNIIRRIAVKARNCLSQARCGFATFYKLRKAPEGVLLKENGAQHLDFIDTKDPAAVNRLIEKFQGRRQQTGEFANLSVGTKNAQTRDTWIEAVLTALPAGTRLLDAGAGEMQYKKFCGHLDYVSQDLSAYDGSGNESGLQTGTWDTRGIDIVSDICAMPVADASFDAVLCTEVLEHVTNPVDAVRELARVLKPGGKIILTAPFCSLTHFAPYHYSTGFNKYFYLHHLGELGFENIEIVENGNYFEFLAQELRRLPLMAQEHASSKIGSEATFSSNVILAELEKLSQMDSGSKELLHFDCQVIAVKKQFTAQPA